MEDINLDEILDSNRRIDDIGQICFTYYFGCLLLITVYGFASHILRVNDIIVLPLIGPNEVVGFFFALCCINIAWACKYGLYIHALILMGFALVFNPFSPLVFDEWLSNQIRNTVGLVCSEFIGILILSRYESRKLEIGKLMLFIQGLSND
jgi:hypothetical protein